MPSIESTLAERGARYGAFPAFSDVTQTLKTIFKSKMGEKWDLLADDQKEALEMIAHKLARIITGDPHYDDSWRDIAGYAQLVANRLAAPAATPAPQPTQPTTFKVGDKVKIADKVNKEAYTKSSGPGYHDEMTECLGKVGVVTDLDDRYVAVRVSVEDRDWWFRIDDLTLVGPGTSDKAEEPRNCPICSLERALAERAEGKALIVDISLDDKTDPIATLLKALAAKK